MKKFKLLGLVMFVIIISSVSYSQTPFSFGLTGGASIPMGEFNNIYKTGFSVEGAGFYSVSPNTAISLTIGYNGFSYKNEYFTDAVKGYFGADEVKGFDVSWSATDIPVMAGIKYFIPVPGVSPYLWGEIGAHFLSFSDRFNGNDVGVSSSNKVVNVTSLSNSSASESETAFGYSVGAGLSIPILPKILLDLNLKYNGNGAVFSKNYTVKQNANSFFTNPELKNMTYLSVRAGILISL